MTMESKHTQAIFPWYRERLQTKYLKAPANKLSSVSSCCRFVNTSLDDFSVYSSVAPGAQRGGSPVIFWDALQNNFSQKPRKSISKEHACFSKQMIQKQMRKEYVASVEEQLKQHLLTMHPTYKDHLTPELFNQVVAVLDPDMCVRDTSALPAPSGDHAQEEEDEENCSEPSKEEAARPNQKTTKPKTHDVQNPAPRNPYVIQANVKGIERDRAVSVKQPSTIKDIKVAARGFRK
ncbi:protein FAM47E [Archocentrus centrarchus]|uniref:protein FAM47E n=1 Tax=Archocentrus centrarchus TaxID=63155 RepID=UPI0011E9B60E|nr:uncharacterized protein LOC115786127 [Archocentrus centrarchus]